MMQIICVEVDAPKIGEGDNHYGAGVKDLKDEDDMGAGNQVDLGQLVDCCVGTGDGGYRGGDQDMRFGAWIYDREGS